MLEMLKRLLRPFTRKFGIRIVYNVTGSFDLGSLYDKYQALILETEGLYREVLFPKLPVGNTLRLRLMSGLIGTQISEAIYILNFLHESLALEGDVCEFGVAQGATSALMAFEIRGTSKNIWLFDSFEGLPKPSEKDVLKDDILNLGSMEAYEGRMAMPVQMVIDRLKEINFPPHRTKIVPGFVEETMRRSNLPEKVCFAYVDFDFYEPISIALSFLDRVLRINGFVVVDDYGHFSTGAQTAVDEFMAVHDDRYTFCLPVKSAGSFCILRKIG